MTDDTKRLQDVGSIDPRERDFSLDLHSPNWGTGLSSLGWKVTSTADRTKYVSRTIISRVGDDRETRYFRRRDEDSPDRQKDLCETIIRFPSAPIYGIHRKQEYLYTLTRINYHTMRLIRRPCSATKRVKRIYLFHSGLNEIDRLRFYYRLADLLLKDEDSACIIRPMPGHLTRCPFPEAYAQKPLDRYLADAGDLLRQFLRFMVETLWLLSALVPLRSYRVVAGLDLLAEGARPRESREDGHVLAQAIHRAWRAAYDASQHSEHVGSGLPVEADGIEGDVEVIRQLVGWRPTKVGQGPPPKNRLPPPALHAIGYSMGGYLAQSVFFTWPFAVSSCTTIGSGGPLRDVTLTTFAHPEEWQTVMYALRFEIESAMLQGKLVRSKAENGDYLIAGVNEDDYAVFDRIFNDVFLQDFRGPYRQRVSEYVDRLLFVLGGMDPVISTRSIIDSSPRQGINMIQVANLAHFPWSSESEWRRFWLPQVTGVIRAFSHRTEEILAETLNTNWDLWSQAEAAHAAGT